MRDQGHNAAAPRMKQRIDRQFAPSVGLPLPAKITFAINGLFIGKFFGALPLTVPKTKTKSICRRVIDLGKLFVALRKTDGGVRTWS